MKKTSVRVDGISSPLLEAGPSEAVDAVVFVHGNPGSIADWTRLAASVGEFARVVLLCRRRESKGVIKRLFMDGPACRPLAASG
ncbi:alpha/beta fold hydrolase [Caballeronia sp. LjRoot31]|jgi:hypothetical protein|uniref:alpha/beta fold hydrolase n=1 Tax=Caballeronia sp. LjRoot31 TaxID=3342324 RepID=UPI003ED104CB